MLFHIKKDKDNRLNTDKLLKLSALLALAIIMGYVEYLIPIPIGIPGIKLGLSNVVTLICLCLYSEKEAFLVLFLRIFLSGLLFGNFYSVLFGSMGGTLSFICMFAAFMINGRKSDGIFSITGISMIGGVTHNIGQIVTAAFVINEVRVIYYLPVLMIAGLVTGALTGVLSVYVLRPLGGSTDQSFTGKDRI
ncbi:MAG: Gx transporter family protein [Lachnospiraceae bacterium]|nr:Gx transporter family protein [Lachnospiraceae bacterium]